MRNTVFLHRTRQDLSISFLLVSKWPFSVLNSCANSEVFIVRGCVAGFIRRAGVVMQLYYTSHVFCSTLSGSRWRNSVEWHLSLLSLDTWSFIQLTFARSWLIIIVNLSAYHFHYALSLSSMQSIF